MEILICGIGAIGSNLVSKLVPDLRGEHDITILDRDKVEKRNITAGTQFYINDQVGEPKVEALQYNIYKWYNREVHVRYEELTPKTHLEGYDLIVDCFDNHFARNLLAQNKPNCPVLHIGFSDNFTFAIEWNENYKTPSDITSNFDICEMPGASAFVSSVASLGALVIQKFLEDNSKWEIIGGKYHHSVLKGGV